MIQTVLGPREPKELGITLMHEHIMVDYAGADFLSPDRYDRAEVVAIMLPFLQKLKKAGCGTFVDATPPGNGRDIQVLQECSRQSGLHIVACTGTFRGKGVSSAIRAMDIPDIVHLWEEEYWLGMDGTGSRPGCIKIALDDGAISPLQEKILRAAARTSLRTGLPIQSHTVLPITMFAAAEILEEEGLPLDKFIWTHSDCENDLDAMVTMGRRGVWLQIDSIGYFPYERHVQMLKHLCRAGLVEQMLLSQDRGWYVVGKDKGKFVNPYHPLLTEFIPLCRAAGIAGEMLNQMLVANPAKVLDLIDPPVKENRAISSGQPR